MKSGRVLVDSDDVAEGRGASSSKRTLDDTARATADAAANALEPPVANVDGEVAEVEGEPPAKKVRLPKAEKRRIRREAEDAAWALKKAAKAAAKLEAKLANSTGDASDIKVKQGGQNKVLHRRLSSLSIFID
jgi:hypothetical protein